MKNRRKPANDFQIWLMSKGYYRTLDSLHWIKDGHTVNGKQLSKLLNEFKALQNRLS